VLYFLVDLAALVTHWNFRIPASSRHWLLHIQCRLAKIFSLARLIGAVQKS
jgi:hypothetical protein